MSRDRVGQLRLAAAYTILTAFTASMVVDMISATYTPPPGIQAITAIVGIWLFGAAGKPPGK